MFHWSNKNKVSKFGFLFISIWMAYAHLSICEAITLREIDKKIESHQNHLKELKDQIRNLESEKGKLKQDESTLMRTIKRIESEIEQSRKRQVSLNKQVRETELKIKASAQGIRILTSEGLKLEEMIILSLRQYHTRHFYPYRLRTHRMENIGSRTSMALQYSKLKDTHTQKNLAVKRENQLVDFKRNLLLLKVEMEEEILKQRKAQVEKKKIYETTQGKRLIAEQEVQRLRDTSRSLGELLSQLVEKKEKSLAAQREAEMLRKSFQEKRGTFSWPVQGQVVSTYGRQKHPDLGITVINNGVKIKVLPDSPVKAVEKGIVIYAADFRSYGQTVIVDHGGDTFSVYGLLGNILVKEGEKVTEGTVLGRSYVEDESPVYFEFRNQGRAENPLLWLK